MLSSQSLYYTSRIKFYFLFCFTLLNIATCATSSTDKYETLLLLLLTGILSPLLILECTNKADIYGESRTLELLISITFLSVNFYNLSPVLRVLKLIIELSILNLGLHQLHFFQLPAISFCDALISLVIGPVFSTAFTAIKLGFTAMYICSCYQEKSMYHHETVRQSHSLIERVENLEKEHKMLQAKHDADTKTFPLLTLLSNELRNSMNGVMGLIGLLKDSELTNEQLEFTVSLEKSIDNLMYTVNDSLDHYKIQANDITFHESEFFLEDLLEGALNLVIAPLADKNVDIFYEKGASWVQSYLIGDPSILQSMLVNLLVSGIRAVSEGEIKIQVEIEHKEDNRIIAHFMITNSKQYIDDQDLPKVFEPYSKAGGYCLALANCEKLVYILKGNISVRCDAMKGTITEVSVPLVISDRVKEKVEIAKKEFRVFIIDDNENVIRFLTNELEEHGCKVKSANNWVDGVQELKKASVVYGAPYRMLFIDFWMPGLRGDEVVKLIKKDKTISAVSTIMMCSPYQKQLMSSLYIHLFKPIKKTDLAKLISQVSRDSPASRLAVPKIDIGVKLNVLVAEDNVMNQRIIKSMVEKAGHNCICVDDGEKALEQYSKQSIDVIFMDCRMPVLDGYECTIKIRELESSSGAHVPIIALTGDVIYGTKEQCLKVGMDDYLTKPISRAAVEEILRNLASRKTTRERSSSMSSPNKHSGEIIVGEEPHVLLVEDNIVNARILSVIMKKHNFVVEVACDGKVAMQKLTENHDKYRIILMDMFMPVMDGQTATKLIRQFEEEKGLEKIPVIAMTANRSEGYRKECIDAGCTEFMNKPIDYNLLVSLSKTLVKMRTD